MTLNYQLPHIKKSLKKYIKNKLQELNREPSAYNEMSRKAAFNFIKSQETSLKN